VDGKEVGSVIGSGSGASYGGKFNGKASVDERGSAVFASDETTLFSNPRGSVVDYSSSNQQQDLELKKQQLETEQSLKEKERVGEQVGGEEDEVNYPGPLGLFVLITGIALSVFLISLDRTIITTVRISPSTSEIMKKLIGTGNPIHLERVPVLRRYRLVRLVVSADCFSIPAIVWQGVHAVQHEVDVSSLPRHVRTRKSDLWRCAKFSRADCWTGDCWVGECGDLDGEFCGGFSCGSTG
jgi:hypothetical protein